MNTTFYIVLNVKTTTGFESYGNFCIGNDREDADFLFSNLKGSKELGEDGLLHMDLMETSNGLPVNIKVLCCTLEEITFNCKYITKEVFKNLNLKGTQLR